MSAGITSVVFFFEQKTAYEMRISDWSADVCSSDLIKHYRPQLRGKTILCNCDDPFESNFFKYFALNFNTFGLKKLIATSYKKSPIVGTNLPPSAIEGLKPVGSEQIGRAHVCTPVTNATLVCSLLLAQ